MVNHRIISGIVYVINHGLMWRDAPKGYGPQKTIYNRFARWSRLGVFNRIFAELAGAAGAPDQIMIDATHLKAHRTASSLLKEGALPRCIWRTKGGLDSKLQTVCDWQGQPIVMILTEGQMSEHKGAVLLFSSLPKTKGLLGDKGHDSNGACAALASQAAAACIPPKANRKVQYHYDKQLYRQHHKIENLFGRINDWRTLATRRDRCAHTVMCANSMAATACSWL